MTTSIVTAAVAAGCIALLLPDSGGRLRRILPGGDREPAPVSQALLGVLLSVGFRPRLAALMIAVPTAVLAGPIAAAVAAVAAGLLARALARSRASKAEVDALAAAGRSIAGLAAELRAGRSPTEALDAVAGSAPESVAAPLLAAARAARLGADPAAALAEHAGGVPAMERLAACWRVARRTGAGLADVADALAADLRAAHRRRGQMAVEVAAARASAKLLAGLPLVGIALGASLGARPLHFLLHTPLGAAVLGVGLLFESAGLLWTDRLIRGVERPK
jgi:tight adherence protein B